VVGLSARLARVEVSVVDRYPSARAVHGVVHGCAESDEAGAREQVVRVRSALEGVGVSLDGVRTEVRVFDCETGREVLNVHPSLDLAIAVAFLAALGRLRRQAAEGIVYFAELGLSGTAHQTRGALPAALACANHPEHPQLVVSQFDIREAMLSHYAYVVLVADLRGTLSALTAGAFDTSLVPLAPPPSPSAALDMADVPTSYAAKRALEIAAAGGHDILLLGPPDSAKMLLAQRARTILPALSAAEEMDVRCVYSVAGLAQPNTGDLPAFRAPHHSVSVTGVRGGGRPFRPGEAMLARFGILYMHDLHEFSREVAQAVDETAGALFISSSTLCPCGRREKNDARGCVCSPSALAAHESRLLRSRTVRRGIRAYTSAFADRSAPKQKADTSAEIRARVEKARAAQRRRRADASSGEIVLNADLNAVDVAKFCEAALVPAARALAENALWRLDLSHLKYVRAWRDVLRVSRTIADLAGSELIDVPYVQEALELCVSANAKVTA
jgi:magnesium chelatase family protein